MEKEKTIIWTSQVLIPFSISGSVHAFLGPLPKSSTKPVKLNKFFPCLPYCKPRAFEDKIFELGIIDSPSLCIMFFSFYQQWSLFQLVKQNEKEERTNLERSRHFYLIQLLRTGPKYNNNMPISTFYFGEILTNEFHLHCRMITPTLFNVTAITGLRPTVDIFDHTLKNYIKPNFSFTHASFNPYIQVHYDQTEEVSDYEHIAFLTL